MNQSASVPDSDPASDRDPRTRPVVLLGPTAGGKSELAIGLAERLDPQGVVIGADSMQVYRGMDVGTAKPSLNDRARAPHRLIDIADTTERFTVHDGLAAADAEIVQARAQGRRPIVVGGTNLYLKALLEGLFEGPGVDEAYRAQLETQPPQDLHRRLVELDPESAARIEPNDRRRIVRALEVHHATGRPISDWQRQWSDARAGYRHDPILLGLRWPVEAINRRINLRVKAMCFPERVPPEMAAAVCWTGCSLFEEVEQLVGQGRLGPDAPQAREALGYKQVLAWREATDPKLRSIDDVVERTKVLTRRFAKQQRTWLRRFHGAIWIDEPDFGQEPGDAEPAGGAERRLQAALGAISADSDLGG
ncbi:MAG: tRNA (adenosine(37)-N6)-dimethylallyltransferase MiaA [Planctomycetota bacterium]